MKPLHSFETRNVVLRQNRRGFGLVSALFLLVVLAALGVAMVNISSMQHKSSAMDVEGVHAYHAARAGAEWGLYNVLNTAGNPCFASPTTFPLPAGSSLSNYTVTVTCRKTSLSSLSRWQVVSIACNKPNGSNPGCPGNSTATDYIERQVQVDF